MITSVRHLSMKFGDYRALDDVNLDIGEGEFVAVLGPSGCGKTTLLRLLAGFFIPSAGTISMNGSVVAENGYGSSPNQRNIGMVFQSYALWPHMTVFQQILFPLRHSRIKTWTKKDMEERAMEMLCLVGMGHLAGRYPSELSGGQRQRVALARSLADKPGLLLMDEPLSNLDAKLRVEMRLAIKNIQNQYKITTLYVTHDQEEALTMSDTVVVMNGGKVQQIGTPEDIYNEPKNAFVADFIGDSNIVDGVMHRDFLVSFSGVEFPCVDRGFAREESVQVVVRPEDIEVVSPVEGQLVGVVNDVIFKGVHFEMHVECEGREWLIHSTRACTPGETIGMRIGPNEIHIMSRSEG